MVKQSTHNRLSVGSIPTGPTNSSTVQQLRGSSGGLVSTDQQGPATSAAAGAKMLPKCHTKFHHKLVDRLGLWCYTINTMRAKRNDRNHIIYAIVGPQGSYIGVTAKTESTVLKSVRARIAKHYYRAKTETKQWALCELLRSYSSKDEVDVRVIEIVRGKAAAHRRERELIRAEKPFYNTDKRGV